LNFGIGNSWNSDVFGEEKLPGGEGLRILSLTSLFPSNVNPVRGVFIKERVRHLAKLHDLRVVAPVPYFPRIKLHRRWYQYAHVRFHERIANMEVYHPRYFIIPRVGMVFYGLFYFLSILHFMKKISRKYPFDILDAHYLYPDGLAAVLLAKTLKKPVVLSARGTDINVFMTFPLVRGWILYALRNCDHIIAVSAALKRRMVDAGINARKIDVVPNGVDVRQFRSMSKNEARTALGLPQRSTIVLSVGSLRPSKGFQYLLQAVKEIRSTRRDLDLRLNIVGYGQYKRKLEKEIARLELGPYVNLVGRVPHCQMHSWYCASDLFCLASSTEGWPNVLFEALACGIPVVATAVGGVPEILVSEEYGLVLNCDQGSHLVSHLRDGLLAALKKKWNREKMIAYARQNTWEAVAQRVDGIFRQVLNGRD
jgi:glycosyltransferase involved in cell wall biosynthesis